MAPLLPACKFFILFFFKVLRCGLKLLHETFSHKKRKKKRKNQQRREAPSGSAERGHGSGMSRQDVGERAR
jgi:hypothetical protein